VLGKLTGRDRGSNGMFVAQGALVERDDVLEARGLRTAVVGGRGIGKAIARALAAEGCDLGLVARTQWPRGGTPAELASESGRRVVALPADTGADAAAETMAARALAVRGGAEILVNAAATPNTGAAVSVAITGDAIAAGGGARGPSTTDTDRDGRPALLGSQG
jgi:NAD(P)-dependent dehydrogenase (short-subunit alcohol dehydrogenase family)